MPLTTKTKYICSISDPSVDLCGVMYNAMIDALGADAAYLVTRCENAAQGIAAAKALNLSGFSCSMPHKQAIMEKLDAINPDAKAIGAVNTVVLDDEQWVGYNTDSPGAVNAILEQTELKGKKVLLIGAGGAARAVAYGVSKAGATLCITNRTLAKAQTLADEMGATALPISCLQGDNPFDIVINSSSVGFNDSESSPVPADFIGPNQWAFDLVFALLETKFLADAKANGGGAIYGHRMFLHQAILQLELWTGKTLETEKLEDLEELMKEYLKENGF